MFSGRSQSPPMAKLIACPAITHGSVPAPHATTAHTWRVRSATTASTTTTSGGPTPKSRLYANPATNPRAATSEPHAVRPSAARSATRHSSTHTAATAPSWAMWLFALRVYAGTTVASANAAGHANRHFGAKPARFPSVHMHPTAVA